MGARRDVALENQRVRFFLDGNENGEQWVEAVLRNGALQLRGQDGLVLRLMTSNSVDVKLVDS